MKSYDWQGKTHRKKLRVPGLKTLIHTNKELKKSQAYKEAFIRSIQDLIIVMDENLVYREIYAQEPDKLIDNTHNLVDRPLEQVMTQEPALTLFGNAARQTIATGEPSRVDYFLDLPQGRLWFDARITPLEQGEKGKTGVLCIIRDITLRVNTLNEIQKNEHLFRSVLNAIRDGVSVMDTELNITLQNETAAALDGIAPSAVGKKCYEVCFGLNKPCQPCYAYMAMKEKQLIRKETLFEKGDDPKRYFEVYAYPILDDKGEATGVVEYLHDVTEIKLAQDRLMIEKDRAELANQAKTRFLENMSHELRTPLNGLMGMNQLLELTDLSEEQQQYNQNALRACGALASVINEIISYTHLETTGGVLDQVAFSPEELLHEVMDLNEVTALSKNLAISYHVSPEVPSKLVGDRFKLKQILNNLTGNAVKFTEQGGVQLALSAKKESTGQWKLLFQVQDTGIGIPLEKMGCIFNIFSQVEESDTRWYGGVGLGLSIAQELANLLGGSLSVKSEIGKGSCFELTCPMQEPIQASNPIFHSHS